LAGFGEARPGSARSGLARRGMSGNGEARHGEILKEVIFMPEISVEAIKGIIKSAAVKYDVFPPAEEITVLRKKNLKNLSSMLRRRLISGLRQTS